MSTWIKGIAPQMLHEQFGIYHGQWMTEMDRCWIRKEDGCCVCSRLIRTLWGKIEHVTITRRDQTKPDILTTDGSSGFTWAEKQQIKDELFGKNRVAIEVYPPEDRLIDSADVYHLWVFEKNFRMPFGIHPKEYQKAIRRGCSINQEEMAELKKYYAEKGNDVMP